MNKPITLLVSAVLPFLCLTQCTTGHLEGEWYGIHQGGPITVSQTTTDTHFRLVGVMDK